MSDLKIPGYLTTSEAAERYGVKPDTLKKKCQKNKIRGAIKQGKTWFVPSIPGVDPQESISNNYPSLNFESATHSNLLLYDAEDQSKYFFYRKYNSYIYIWEYGYYFVSLVFSKPLHKSYMPIAALITEAHSALRGAFLLNLNGYHSDAMALLRRVHENTIKAIAIRTVPAKAWHIIPSSQIQRAEAQIGLKLKEVWSLESNFAHSNLLKVGNAAKNLNDGTDIGVTFGPQKDDKLFVVAANLSIFWLYVLITCLPYLIADQMGKDWLSSQKESAKLMKDYLISSGALKNEIKNFDLSLKKILSVQKT